MRPLFLCCIAMLITHAPMLRGDLESTRHLATLSSVATRNNVPALVIPYSSPPQSLDGTGKDPAWNNAIRIDLQNFWAPSPDNTQATQVSLLHDGNHLYVAFDCEDHDIRAIHTRPQDQTWRDDCVEIFLAPPDERLTESLGLEINAIGTLSNFYYRHPDWTNAYFNSKSRITASQTPTINGKPVTGFRVEVAIPYSTLQSASSLQAGKPNTPLTKTNEQEPLILRANFARWDHRSGQTAERQLSIWSDPQFTDPHPHRPDRYGWILFKPASSSATP